MSSEEVNREGNKTKEVRKESEEYQSEQHQNLTIRQAIGLAVQHQAAGDLGKAEDVYQQILQTEPNQPIALSQLGVIAHRMGKNDIAVEFLTRALVIEPGRVDAQFNLGVVQKELGRLDEAIASYRKALASDPNFAAAHINLGITLQEMGRLDEAIASYRQALAIKPDLAEAHNNLGITLQELGRLEEAATHYRRALAAKPDYAEAHRHLAQIRICAEYDHDVKAMEDSYAMPGLEDEQRMHLAFGLGKSFEDLGQYEKAFEFFSTGNAIRCRTYGFSTEISEKQIGYLQKLFTSSLFREYHGVGSPDQTPIFILGMPRSGTTLVEQILASHPNVHGAGEVDYLSQIVASYFSNIDDSGIATSIEQTKVDGFSRAGEEYIGKIRECASTANFVTDKMTTNFMFVGIIKLILPNAKIIHCRRDPLDTCLSIFFETLFHGKGHHYAYDPRLLGKYYNSYRDLMTHWHKVLPDFIYDIQYEDVVAEQEKQSRNLLSHCGLEWDDSCLEYFRTERPVRTTSSAQVRRPIYNESVQSWRRYENQLTPLLEVIADR